MLYRAWEHTLISRARFFWYGCAIVQSTDVALAYDMLAWRTRVQPIPNSVRRVETRVETRAILAKLAEFRVELESQLDPTRVRASLVTCMYYN